MCGFTRQSAFSQHSEPLQTPQGSEAPQGAPSCSLPQASFSRTSPHHLHSLFHAPQAQGTASLAFPSAESPRPVTQASKTALKRTSTTQVIREQLEAPRAALDTLRLLGWTEALTQGLASQLCVCGFTKWLPIKKKGCFEPPCRLQPRKYAGLSTNTSTEQLAAPIFRERGEKAPPT